MLAAPHGIAQSAADQMDAAGGQQPEALEVGQFVEAARQGQRPFRRAVVLKIRSDGSMDVRFHDGYSRRASC